LAFSLELADESTQSYHFDGASTLLRPTRTLISETPPPSSPAAAPDDRNGYSVFVARQPSVYRLPREVEQRQLDVLAPPRITE